MLNSESGQVVISSKINIFLCLFLRKCKFKMYDFNVLSTQKYYVFFTAGKANRTELIHFLALIYASAMKWCINTKALWTLTKLLEG